MIDGNAAAQWLLNYGSVTPGRCLYYVWLAYKAQGASTDRGAPNALIGWGDSDGQRPGDRNPPAGAAVWWGRRYRDGNVDGDVVISLGGGRVAVTEAPGMGSVTGSCTLDEREKQIGREYLGWTSSIFDCPINVASGKDSFTSPDMAPARRKAEDGMYIKGTSFPDIYKTGEVWNSDYPKGQVLLRACTPYEAQCAIVGGLVVTVDDGTLTNLAKMSGYGGPLATPTDDAIIKGIQDIKAQLPKA